MKQAQVKHGYLIISSEIWILRNRLKFYLPMKIKNLKEFVYNKFVLNLKR